MTVRVALSDPRLLSRLAQSLRENACTIRPLSDRAFELTTFAPEGDDEETRLDVAFFLRAWQDAHPGADLLVG